MANALDEQADLHNQVGQDINVINKSIQVTIGTGTLLFEVAVWILGFIPGLLALSLNLLPAMQAWLLLVVGIVPGLVFLFLKVNALAYLKQLEQRIQADASEIDNFLEQRVIKMEVFSS